MDFSFSPKGNCTKKYPQTCRLHGKAYKERAELLRQVKQKEEADKFKLKADPDFEASWKVRQEKDGATTVAVYRSGVTHAPEKRGVESQSYTDCDAQKPEGRQGRTDGIFAAPTLGGVARWVEGNYFAKILDVKVREIRVDIDKTYVYSIIEWERASGDETSEGYKKFWGTGMPLREYMRKAKANPIDYDPQEWELLLAPDDMRSVKAVGAARVAQRSYSDYESVRTEVKRILSEKLPQ